MPAATAEPAALRATGRRATPLLRRLLLVVALAAGLALGALGAVTWYYADELLVPVDPPAAEPDVEVLEPPDDGLILLAPGRSSLRPGTWGLQLEDAFVRLGPIVEEGDEAVVREAEVVSGDVVAGDLGALEGTTFPGDPQQAFDFDVSTVSLPGPLGPLPAYLAEAGDGETWAVLVHGRGGTRRQTFPYLPVLHELGVTSLAISYRNDSDIDVGDGRYGLGETESEDVEAAVEYALEEGAEQILLVGFSMGGTIVLDWLSESAHADRAAGVILDAPVLRWRPTLELAGEERGLPEWLTTLTMRLVELRTPARFDELDQLARADELSTEVLVIHGTGDMRVPIELSVEYADRAPERVHLVPIEFADHNEAYNTAPTSYVEEILKWLDTNDVL